MFSTVFFLLLSWKAQGKAPHETALGAGPFPEG